MELICILIIFSQNFLEGASRIEYIFFWVKSFFKIILFVEMQLDIDVRVQSLIVKKRKVMFFVGLIGNEEKSIQCVFLLLFMMFFFRVGLCFYILYFFVWGEIIMLDKDCIVVLLFSLWFEVIFFWGQCVYLIEGKS